MLQNIHMDIASTHFHLVHQFLKVEYFQIKPETGDVIVFKTPADNRTDYIKRLVGLPGDAIQFIDGDIFLNNNQILKSRISKTDIIYCGKQTIEVNTFEEKLHNGENPQYSIFEKL